tara:strand:- start:187 stop:615 length:429 start_codon:yes stop_codon:yes gene_type:complete
MGDYINLSIYLPLLPLGMSIFIFILLRLFNRTVNRLTKPISFLLVFSILISTFVSLFLLVNHIEGNIPFPILFTFLEKMNLEIHLNELREKIIILLGLISCSVILFSLIKLPRQRGYVLYVINIGLITSLLIFGILTLGLNI